MNDATKKPAQAGLFAGQLDLLKQAGRAAVRFNGAGNYPCTGGMATGSRGPCPRGGEPGESERAQLRITIINLPVNLGQDISWNLIARFEIVPRGGGASISIIIIVKIGRAHV